MNLVLVIIMIEQRGVKRRKRRRRRNEKEGPVVEVGREQKGASAVQHQFLCHNSSPMYRT